MGGFGSVPRLLKGVARYSSSLLLENYYRQRIKGLPEGLNTSARPRSVIVTLSTTPKRLLQKSDIAITALLRQKFRPDRIILWLSDELKDTSLPKSFGHLMDAGLSVQYRRDVGPHTKLLYALQEFPDSIIVSADDDVLYPSNWLADLYASYQLAPHYIHCHCAHLIGRDDGGKLSPYRDWKIFAPGYVGPSHLLFPLGVGGVLYPPRSLASEVFNVEVFRQLCPHNDDIWFKAMALLQGTLCQKVKPYWQQALSITGSQQGNLYKTNIIQNDPQLRATFDAYDLYGLL